MINISELRIGNILYLNGFNTVESITSRDFIESGQNPIDESELILKDSQGNYYECNINHDDLKPVPLTEEILSKCGYEQSYFASNNLPAFWCIDGRIFICKDLKLVYWNTEIQYLHQLQNIYFFISGGKELEVEL